MTFQPYYSGLVAVSSFRPFSRSPEIAANQLRAKKSWDQVFDRIFLFGEFEQQLASPVTEFIPCQDWPSIASLVLTASWQQDPVCILNADIVVAHHLKNILNEGWKKQALALTSKRYEFEPTLIDHARAYDEARVVDVGVDFFCAFPQVWRQVYKEIPPGFRLGHQKWDSYMLAWLWHNCQRRFFDMTQHRPIYHPRHGERHMPHHIEVPEDCFYMNMGFPPLLP